MGFEERQEKRKKSVVAQIAGVSEPENKATGIFTIKPKEETRSKKFPVSVKPKLHEAAKEKAEEAGYSLNEIINQLLENWVNGK